MRLRERPRSASLTSVAALAATCALSSRWGMSRSAWTARPISWKWRRTGAAAQSCIRILSRWTCRLHRSKASSPTLPCSTFPVPCCDVLLRLHAALKPRGVLFSSNPRGHNEEGWNGPRYGCYYDFETWSEVVTAAGFEPITHYYRPAGLPREQQPWLASVWRKG